MKPRRQHRRLFWPGGLVSLGLMAMLFSWVIGTQRDIARKVTIEVNLPPAGDLSAEYQPPLRPAVQRIEHDSIEAFSECCRRLTQSRDTIHAALLQLERSTPYRVFVKAIEVTEGLHDDRLRYSLVDGNVYAFYWPPRLLPPGSTSPFICGGVSVSKVILPGKRSRWEQARDHYGFLVEDGRGLTSAVLCGGWLLLGGISLARIRNLRRSLAATRHGAKYQGGQ